MIDALERQNYTKAQRERAVDLVFAGLLPRWPQWPGWACVELGARNSTRVSHKKDRGPSICAICCPFAGVAQGAGFDVQQTGVESALLSDSSVASGGLACCLKELILIRTTFIKS